MATLIVNRDEASDRVHDTKITNVAPTVVVSGASTKEAAKFSSEREFVRHWKSLSSPAEKHQFLVGFDPATLAQIFKAEIRYTLN